MDFFSITSHVCWLYLYFSATKYFYQGHEVKSYFKKSVNVLKSIVETSLKEYILHTVHKSHSWQNTDLMKHFLRKLFGWPLKFLAMSIYEASTEWTLLWEHLSSLKIPRYVMPLSLIVFVSEIKWRGREGISLKNNCIRWAQPRLMKEEEGTRTKENSFHILPCKVL